MDDTDATLIERCRDGDLKAFDRLVEKYQGRLYNSLVHWSGSPEDAEDIAQETFVQAYRKLDSFQGRSSFFTWLYRIAFHLAVSRTRRKRREQSLEARVEETGQEVVSEDESAERLVLRAEQVAMVRKAIACLQEDHRAVLVLRDLEGLCYETIGEILELAPGTVRSRLHRARQQLRELLKELLVEPLPD